MRNLIIESIGRPIETDFSKTSVAHARNSVILSGMIGADIITGEKDMGAAEGKTYDNIICCYASPYMKYKKLIDVVRRNPLAQLWWFVNDHDLEDNILLRNVLKETNGARKINMVCNNARENYRGWILRKKIKNTAGEVIGVLDDFIEKWYTVNINAMIFSYELPYSWESKTCTSVYYGTMRKWRLDDLREYQDCVTVSATPRTQKKLAQHGVGRCGFTDKLSWRRGEEDLARFKFSLYVEDLHTHDHYAHLANRYYEGLMCNVVTLFDAKCAENIKKSGFDIADEFIVANAGEFKARVATMSRRLSFEAALAHNEKNKRQARAEHKVVTHILKSLFCGEPTCPA